jgi:hypothetical protein
LGTSAENAKPDSEQRGTYTAAALLCRFLNLKLMKGQSEDDPKEKARESLTGKAGVEVPEACR